MSQSPDPSSIKGGAQGQLAPKSSTPAQQPPLTDSKLLRQFVMEYLQSHGFDKALEKLTEQVEDANSGVAANAAVLGDADVSKEDADGKATTGEQGGEREAIFRAPGPVPLESNIKRNIPQAQAVSASTMSDRITPEFEAQAKYIIEQLQKKVEAVQEEGGDEKEKELRDGAPVDGAMVDVSEKVTGYEAYRRWVDGGLDVWKAELDNLSFPLFVLLFLDVIHSGFLKTAREFFEKHSAHHRELHPQDISALSSVSTEEHIKRNPFCARILSEKYVVPLSRNAYDLLLQWLSGASLDDEWEAGLHSAPGRQKEAIKLIVVSHLNITVSNDSAPLDKVTIASKSGLISSSLPPNINIDAFNTAAQLKLGPPPMTEKLKEQVTRTLQDEGEAQGANGDANGDIDMISPLPTNESVVKLEPDAERDPSVISPDESETLPPIPAVFRIADLKREVEAIKDKRKMIRLGPSGSGASAGSGVLPSVVAFTLFDHGENANSVEFSRDSSLMAVGSSESCVRLWSLKGDKLKKKGVDIEGNLVEDEGLPMRKLIGHSGPVYSLSFDPLYGSAGPPSTLLSSSQDGSIRLWSMDTYSNLVVYRGHGKDPVWDVEWGPMGVYFASASRDRTARLWSSDRVAPLRMYTGHLSDVNCVKFHPNSLYLATASTDTSCRLWDVQRGACVRLFLGHTDSVTTLSISPDGKTLASAGLDSSIWLWDLGSARPIKKMEGHTGAVTSLSFSAESSVLVSGGLDGTVRCWDVKSAGGERSVDGMFGGADARRGEEKGGLPMNPGDVWDSAPHTPDLLATWPTKRTPILKTHYTPRNLCMVAGSFVPPSNHRTSGGEK
ncbi:transcription initiation factor TFIID subunit 5 [Cryptococcus neoformans c45]|nr:transcription initiation factor TFIID subunit 5 [Cryptococcus neoformans var. grubii c45]